MERKEHDLFMDVVASPEAAYDDFISVGYNPNNTSLLDISVYKNNDWVRDHFKDLYGNFNEGAFQEKYDAVLSLYNNMAVLDHTEILRSQLTYHRNDIFAPENQRRKGPDYQEVKMVNPYRQVYGLTTLGRVEDPTMSIDEIAQSNKVLANPTTAGDDLSNAKWEDTPNGNFGKYFWDTLVLAQYDDDGEHLDPTTGERVKHSKGDFKLNEDGEFYYEKLDGRSIYDRQVLNKGNILTVDGSKWNKYDFFDSDDLNQKSIAGSLIKNTALVGSMFLPVVGPAVLTATLGVSLAGIAATLGKMALGSNSPTLSAIEGWSASMDRRRAKTQYAQEHPWCWESFITMIGDFTEIGATQKFIFNKVPQLLMGEDLLSEAGQATKLEELIKTERALSKTKVDNLLVNSKKFEGQKNWFLLLKSINELSGDELIKIMARGKLQSAVGEAQTLGHALSKGYMALSIANDMYGEAKTLGASDLDATLLTLGYTAGLYGLLNAGVSQWIFPEMRVEGYRAKAIARALITKDKETEDLVKLFGAAIKGFDKKAKKDYVKKVFNVGRKIANAEYATGAKTLSATIAAGIGMGVEGTGFEFLSDLSKGCYDVVKWLQGGEHRMDTFGYNFETKEWHPGDLALGYGTNFLSAVVGGSITGFFGTYNAVRGLNSITLQLAIQEVMYMIRNGKLPAFLKLVDNMELGNRNLSTKIDPKTKNFLPGTDDDNLDLLNKTAIHQWAEMMNNILDAHGANISDLAFLDILTLKELRFAVLLNSSMAGLYLNEFSNTLAELFRVTSSLNSRNISILDINKNNRVEDSEAKKNPQPSPTETKELIELKNDLDRLATKISELVTGKRSYEFIYRALYEMTTILSGENAITDILLYCYAHYGKRFEELSRIDLDKAVKEWETWINSEGREHIRDAADISHLLSLRSSETIGKQINEYTNALHRNEELRRVNEEISKLLLPLLRESGLGLEEYDQLDFPLDADEWLKRALENEAESEQTLKIRLIELLGNEKSKNALNKEVKKLNKSIKDLSQARKSNENLETLKQLDSSRKLAESYFFTATDNILGNTILSYLKDFNNMGYASTELKNLVNNLVNDIVSRVFKTRFNVLSYLSDTSEESLSMLTPDEQNERAQLITDANNKKVAIQNTITAINEQLGKLKELPESPLVRNLDEFLRLVSNTKNNLSIQDTLNEVNDIYNENSENINNFKVSGTLELRLYLTMSIMKLYRATIMAARTDNVGIDNLFGYNATLNEVAERMGLPDRLVEIDKDTADIFINDLNTNISKLEYLYRLNRLNQGLKLSALLRIQSRKYVLTYKRINSIFSNSDPNDPINKWNGIINLRNAIDNMTIHLEMLKDNNFNVTKENEEAFEREKISLEDAVYDFFNVNSDKNLEELINPNRLSLLENVDDILDENIENFSDNSIVWWLCRKAALKSSDFYSLFAEILSAEGEKIIVPLPGQEEGVYLNYASIVNGKMFDRFVDAYNNSIIRYWKGLNLEERVKILTKLLPNMTLEIKEFYSSKLVDDWIINVLPMLHYRNTIFNEGIPGAGKSEGILVLTTILLKKFHPELLENAVIIHGGELSSALLLSETLGLKGIKGIKTFGDREWLKFLGIEKDTPLIDTKTGNLTLSENKVVTTNDNNKFGVVLNIKNFKDDEKPKLIIVDESLRLNWFTLLSIELVARKLGITVISSGDLDLTGIVATTTIPIAGRNMTLGFDMLRTEFARIPKMGTSMRTDNILKTRNLNATRLWMNDPNHPQTTLEYMQTDEGLFGDRVFVFTQMSEATIDPDFKEAIDLMVKTKREGEKIGYIYDSLDKPSPIVKYILENYPDAFDLKTLGSAVGKESQYYIIDVENLNSDNFKKDIYTGISRAMLGSLIVTYNSNNFKLNDKKVNTNINEPLSEESKKVYSLKRKVLLNKIVSPGAEIEIIPRNVSELIATIPDKGLDGVSENPPSSEESPNNPPSELPPVNTPQVSSNEPQVNPSLEETPLEKPKKTRGRKKKDNGVLPKDILSEGALFPEDSTDESVVEEDYTATGDPNSSSVKMGNAKNIEEYEKEKEEAPLMGDGTVRNEDKEIIENLTEITNNSKSVEGQELITVRKLDESYLIDLLIHTFHMFGICMKVENNKIIFKSQRDIEAFRQRIDGANGILKLLGVRLNDNISVEDANNRINEVITVKDLYALMGRLTSHVLHNENKEDILVGVARELGIEKEGLYIDFALKQTGHNSLNNENLGREYVGTLASPFDQSSKEKNSYTYSNENQKFPEKKIVAIIGRVNSETHRRESFLEIPIMGLSSVITIAKVIPEFSKIGSMFPGFGSITNEQLSAIVKNVIKTYDVLEDGKLKYPEYKNLINLFKMFDYGYSDLTYIVTDKNGNFIPATNGVSEKNRKNVNAIITKNLIKSTWTPFKSLLFLGSKPVQRRGEYLIIPGLEYEASNNPKEWISVDEYSKGPRSKTTSNILFSKSGTVIVNGKIYEIAKKGHTFILESDDLSFATDEQMIDLYIKLLTGEETKKKVTLVYVLPPTASVEEYLENLKLIFTSSSDTLDKTKIKSIGQLFTSYKLISKLFKDNRVIKLLQEDKFYDDDVIKSILEVITELDNIRGDTSEEIDEARRDKMNILGSSLFVKDLRARYEKNGSLFRIPYQGTKLSSYFDYLLLEIAYKIDTNHNYHINEKGLSLIKDAARYGIYYNSKAMIGSTEKPTFQYRDMVSAADSDNGYTIDGKPYQIRGKVDNDIFKGCFDSVIQIWLDNARMNDKGMISSDDQTYYELTTLGTRYTNLSSRNQSETEEKPQAIESKSEQTATGIVFNGNSIVTYDTLLKALNLDGKDLQISIVHNGEIVNELSEDMLDGKSYKFKLLIGDKKYDASFENDPRRRKLEIRDEDQCGKSITIKLR